MNQIALITLTLLLSIFQLSAAEKPNFLFIFADDMSLDTIGAYGRYNCKTPNLDKLMHSGVSFTHAYNMGAWNGAVCVASRAMLNSGLFVNRAKAGINQYPHRSEAIEHR